MSERTSFDNLPATNRKAPTILNLIFLRPAAGLKAYRSSVSFAFSPSVTRVSSLKVTSSRAPDPGRYGLVENDGRVEAKRPCGTAARCVGLSQYAADRTDRLLGRNPITGEDRKKCHRNDDQPMQHVPLRTDLNCPSNFSIP